jgi:hypothetical protein
VGVGALDLAITSRRQPQPPLEASLRQLKPVDRRALKLRREHALANYRKFAIVNHRNDILRIDARQSQNDHDLQAGEALPVLTGSKNWRCSRSARASTSKASDNIHRFE